MVSFKGQKKLGPRSIPTLFICRVPPPPPSTAGCDLSYSLPEGTFLAAAMCRWMGYI